VLAHFQGKFFNDFSRACGGAYALQSVSPGLAVLARQGEHGTALAAASDGLSTAEDTGHRQWEAELRRFEGIALSGLNRPEEGQSALEGAMRIARRQQAKAYELRAATSLARLWGEQGRRAEAHELLAPIYGWFTGSRHVRSQRGEGAARRTSAMRQSKKAGEFWVCR
jgi:predicted ATPase